MKEKILKLLSEADDFVSGQDLCREFGVSRTAVWKVINKLKSEGYNIESVTNKGYRLLASPDILSEDEIRKFLDTAYIGREMMVFKVVDSTNTRLMQLGNEGGGVNGMLAVADRQDSGKGRRGRGWETPAGTNIAMSIMLKPDIMPESAPQITLVAALAVSDAIDDLIIAKMKKSQKESGGNEPGENRVSENKLSENKSGGKELSKSKADETGICEEKPGETPSLHTSSIKWPNDIVIDGRKIVGILTEMSSEISSISHIVVGIGINVLNESFDEEIAKFASSIYLSSGVKVRRAELVARVCHYFEKYFDIFLKTCTLEGLQEIYNKKLVNLDREVRVLDPKGEFNGIARGINTGGELIVEKDDGSRVNVYAGEVSVRGIYGYV